MQGKPRQWRQKDCVRTWRPFTRGALETLKLPPHGYQNLVYFSPRVLGIRWEETRGRGLMMAWALRFFAYRWICLHCINLPIIVPSWKVAGTAILSLYREPDTHSAIQLMHALSPINMRFTLNDDSIVSDCTWLRGVPCDVRVAGKIVLLTNTHNANSLRDTAHQQSTCI